jgi:VCBS repeat protein
MLALRLDSILWISLLGLTTATTFPALSAQMQFTQQGPKLVGSGYAATSPQQGTSVAISADGNTIIVGSPGDVDPATGAQIGAAWVFTRTNGTWSQQGAKLVGTGAPGDASQGTSVALSPDGNTAIIGGPTDDAMTGAAWVFTRTNGVWSQQGAKLVGTGAVGLARQGQSVSLSADGNTAIVGGPGDNPDNNGTVGAAWIFTRSNGVWSQSGFKIFANFGGSSGISQGWNVAMSGDGNTAVITGQPFFFSAFVFVNAGGLWTYQNTLVDYLNSGPGGTAPALSGDGNLALLGSGSTGNTNETGGTTYVRNGGTWMIGSSFIAIGQKSYEISIASASISSDGSIAVLGRPRDNNDAGATWVFNNLAGTWTQVRSKLVGMGAVGGSQQGTSVALSSDGSTFVVGGPGDNSGIGAAWIFALSAPEAVAHDFNDDGYSDIAWRDTSGNTAIWLMNGTAATNANSSFVANVPSQWGIVGQRDFNGDGYADLLWRDTSGNVAIWEMNGTAISNVNSSFVANVPTNWSIVGTGDFNGDGLADILWQDTSGNVAIWEMNGTTVLNASTSFVANVPAQWSIKGTGDFNGDGLADILWQDTSGNVAIWEMNGTAVLNASTSFVANVPTQWSLVGTSDFNGDGMSDILWRNMLSGAVAIWEMNGTTVLNANSSFVVYVPFEWSVQLTGDFNGDGMSDVLWQDTSGNVALWEMNGTTIANGNSSFVAKVPGQWSIQRLAAE